MQFAKHFSHKRLFVILITVLLALLFGCNDDNGPTGPKLPADPGPGNLVGIVMGTVNGRVLPGVTVTVGPLSTISDSSGEFRLDGVGEGELQVTLEGTGIIYTRTTSVNTANGRSIFLDAIEENSDFNLGFYRELARFNHPEEGPMHPINRWVTEPTFYIDLDERFVLDGNLEPKTIAGIRRVITTMVPIWTGGTYKPESINEQAFDVIDPETLPENMIIVTFDDLYLLYIGALGETWTFFKPNGEIYRSIIILLDPSVLSLIIEEPLDKVFSHELGHAFGFEHTSLLPSIMPKYAEEGLPDGLYTEADKLHAAVMYCRSPGNIDIDNDPLPNAKSFGETPGWRIHTDRIPNSPMLPENLRQKLKARQGEGKLIQHLRKYQTLEQ